MSGQALDAVADGAGLKRRSVHGALVTFVAQGIKFVLQFASQVVLARLLSPAEFGLVAMVAPIVGFIQLFTDMGLVQATIQRRDITHAQLSALFWINVGAGIALALLLILASPLVAWFYDEPRTMALTASLALPMLLGGFSVQQMALMNRTMRFTSLAAIDVGAALIAAATGIAAAIYGFGYWSLVIMQVANSLAVLVAAWIASSWRPSRPGHFRGIGPLLRFGGDVTAYNVVNFFSYNLDNILIGRSAGSVALGLYNRAFRLMLPSVMQLLTPFTRVAVPLLSRLVDQPEAYRRAFVQIIRAVMLLTAPAMVFSVVMGTQIIVTLLGERWAEAGPIFSWLGFGAVLLPINTAVSWLFISQGRTRTQLHWSVVGSGIVMAAFIVGLPWGPVGVAAAAVISGWVLQTPLLVRAATREGPVRMGEIPRAMAPLAAASLVTGVAMWWAAPLLLPAHSFLSLAAGIAGSYALHGLVLALLPGGRRMMRDLIALAATLRARAR